MSYPNVLDEQLKEEAPVEPRKKRWSWFEKVVVTICALVCIFRALTSELWSYNIIALTMSVLSFGYLFAFYWIDKPTIRSARSIIITVLYGVSFSAATFSVMFVILFLAGGRYMPYVASIAFASTFVIDFISSRGKARIASKITLIRALTFAVLIGVLLIIPEKKQVAFVYRKYPEFVKYYMENTEHDGDFIFLFEEFDSKFKLREKIKNGEY